VNSTENIFLTRSTDTPVFFADPSLDNKTAGSCDLFLLVEKSAVQLALKERRTGSVLALEVIPGSDKKQSDWKQLLENVSANSRILRSYEFSKVTVGITTQEYTLVPEALFKPGDENVYFRKNFSSSMNLVVKAQFVPSFHLYILFGIDQELEKELNHLFQDPQLFHYTVAFLAGPGINRKADSGKQMWMNIHQNKMDIVILENKKLLLMNSFSWQTNEDVLYYSLYVCEQLELNPEKLLLSITGEIEAGSTLVQLIGNYFRNVNIPNKPSSLTFALTTPELSFHKYALLYNLALCE
jgi:hypothetical protein